MDVLIDFLVDYVDTITSSEELVAEGRDIRFTSNELRVMNAVYRAFRHERHCNLSSLSEETGISRATVSRVLTTLFELGIVREEVDEDDRRLRHLYPSETGKRSMRHVAQWLEPWAEKIRAAIAAEAKQGARH